MSINRHDAKRDTTEPEIIAALEQAGCQWKRLSDKAIPDLLVCAPNGETILIECKSKGGKLTPPQVDFFNTWRGKKFIAHSAEEAINIINGLEN